MKNSLNRSAFTLVELLVVVAIIAVLVAVLLPTMGAARERARRAACLSNLHSIHVASVTYSADHNDRFPDSITMGKWNFRRGPGAKAAADAYPEVYGLAAVLDRTKNLPYSAKAWTCPSQREEMVAYGTTYAFSIAGNLAKLAYYMFGDSGVGWVWDNYQQYPGWTGFMGPFPSASYSIKDVDQYAPHPYPKGNPNASGIDSNLMFGINILSYNGRALGRNEVQRIGGGLYNGDSTVVD